ncbi:M16 family metallopeptidase [Pseudomonas sp. KU43P]|uniref:M16 family metallopeptidase n=1 Tax=Pseudomonas sp. KU43P TaxID=2487887 RepID=UPI0012A8BF5A|nr:pitrilysin family protein [Pseudomonas sp. KU43P]BBH43792.1 hypothetical protein KU43P_02690 [Pseudomonas sp. KU43P]
MRTSLSPPLQHFTLANGLTVYLREDQRAPLVSVQLWYHVGSSQEATGQSGLCHLVEHLMFEGSSKLAPGQYNKVITQLGGNPNAFTSPDATCFPVTLPADRLEVVLEIMADSMVTATLGEAVFARELNVVKAERREQTDSVPMNLARERALILANSHMPYATPTVGHQNDLQHLDISAVRAWYDDWYQPNNATLVVVGNTNLQALRAMAERQFGSIARATLPKRWTPEPDRHFKHRCQTIALKGLHPGAILSFNVPSLATAATPAQAQALRLIPYLLAKGYSSRLFSRCVRGDESLLQISADYQHLQRGDSLLTFELAANLANATAQSATARVLQEIEQLRLNAPDANELSRAKNHLLAQRVFDRDDMDKQANTIGTYAVSGLDPAQLDQEQRWIENVTAEEVRAAAHDFLSHERLTITYLQGEAQPSDPAPEGPHEQSSTALSTLGDADLAKLKLTAPEVHTWRTEEGTQVTLVETHQLPMVDLILNFNAGSRLDGDKPGLAALTMGMLDEGTQDLDARQFAERFEQLGAKYAKSISLSQVTIHLRSMTSDVFDPALDLIIDMVARPALNSGELDAIKPQLLRMNRQQQADPRQRAQQAAFTHLYGSHAYGSPVYGTAESIGAITSSDVRDFHGQAYSANNLHISLVGDLTRLEAESIASRICLALPQHWAAAEQALPAFNSGNLHLEHDSPGTTLLMLMPADVQPGEADHPALVLANHVLGGMVDSRLFAHLRQHHGMTYAIGSQLAPLNHLLCINWEVATAFAEASRKQVEDVLLTYISEGPGAAELELARQAMIGDLRRQLATNYSRVKLIAAHGDHWLPADALPTYIERLLAVTPEMAHAAFKSHVDPTQKLIVSVGPTADQ